MEMKQDQTFFLEAYSKLTSIFIGSKILNDFNDFCYWSFIFITKVDTNKQNEIKSNVT